MILFGRYLNRMRTSYINRHYSSNLYYSEGKFNYSDIDNYTRIALGIYSGSVLGITLSAMDISNYNSNNPDNKMSGYDSVLSGFKYTIRGGILGGITAIFYPVIFSSIGLVYYFKYQDNKK